MDDRPRRDHDRIFKDVAIYAVFASLWILLTDGLLRWWGIAPEDWALASTLKGWLFIAVTSLLLWWRLQRGTVETVENPRVRSRWVFVSLVFAILMAAGFGAIQVVRLETAQEGVRLQDIGQLKAEQLANWLRERRLDAELIRTSPYYAQQYERWQGGDAEAGRALISRLQEWPAQRGYSAILVLDPKGRLLAGDKAVLEAMSAAQRQVMLAIAQDHDGRFVGPLTDAHGRVSFDFIAALPTGTAPAPLVVLHIDPTRQFFSRWQQWPDQSKTGEVLLLRRDGNQAVFLNGTRSHKLGDRIPLDGDELLPGALLQPGLQGHLYTAKDIHGGEIVGVAYQVESTDWYVEARMDKSELYGGAVRDVVWLGLTALLLLFMAGAGLLIARGRRQLALAESVHKAQSERLDALQMLDTLAAASDDAIFAKDRQGRYLFFNRAAAEFVGKPADAVLGRDDRNIFPAEQAEMLMATDLRILADGIPESCEEVLDTAIGKRVFLVTKGAIHDPSGDIVGTYGISRDITELKQAENILREQTKLLNEVSALAHVGGWSYGPRDNKITYTPETARIFGLEENVALDLDNGFAYFLPESRPRIELAMREAVEQAKAYDLELEIQAEDGERKWLRLIGTPVEHDGKVTGVHGSVQDITDRKLAELERSASESRYRSLFQSMLNSVTHCRMIYEDDIAVDLEFLDANPAFNEVSGIEGNVVGRRISEVVPGYRQVAQDSLDTFGRVARTGHPERWEHYLKPIGRWFSFSLYSPAPGEIVIVGENITERKQAELALAKSEQSSRLAQEGAHVGIWELDIPTQQVYWSSETEKLYGVQPGSPITLESWLARILPEDIPIAQAVLERSRRQESFEAEFRIRLDSGEVRWMVSRGTTQYDEQGNPIRLSGINLDITRRKQVELELKERNEELERFNKASIGRELDMIELKKKINALSSELGREPPYALAFLDVPEGGTG